MIRTIPEVRAGHWMARLAGIAVFTLLLIASAKLQFETGNPAVPFTLQTLVVLLAGMVLGARDGAFAVALYVGMIALGAPVDARSLGFLALFGPTGGYLVGFIAAAGLAGFITERGPDRYATRLVAGAGGILVIYALGAAHLLAYTGMDLSGAYAVGVAPFLVPDAIKALMAATLFETLRGLPLAVRR
jgi:biotin transport system substrate-specific component